MMYRLFPRRGFNLVELLVVIAIIGLLIAILLPAVQAARETARRAQCKNNLKQLGLAAHMYHDAWHSLPLGGFLKPGRAMQAGIFVRLLPYMEQETVYATWDQSQEIYAPTNATLLGAEVSTLRCPTNTDRDPVVFLGWKVARTSYRGNYGTHYENPAFLSTRADGVFAFEHSHAVTFAEITDGLSNTFLLGENYNVPRRLLAEDSNDYGHWAPLGVGESLFMTSFSINASNDTSLVAPCCTPDDPLLIGASSGHGAGAHFCMADGSVRFVSQSINSWRLSGADFDALLIGAPASQPPRLYQWLSTRAGGEAIPNSY